MANPPLFYVSPEWDEDGQLTRHALVLNCLDGSYERALASLTKPRPLTAHWKPILAIRQLGRADADFLPAFRTTFAIHSRAWEAIRDLAAPSAKALPITITRECSAQNFAFPKLPADPPASMLLLHALKSIPFRHCQHGYWVPGRKAYDMSMGKTYGASPEATKVPWLDPEEFSGLHLFQIMGEWVASSTFVERVQQRGLSGLSFFPIKYEAKPRPEIPKLKKVLPPPAMPDFAAGARGWSDKIGKQWQELWQWTLAALKNRRWPARKPKIQAPLSRATLDDFERKHDIKLPKEFANVLTRFSAGVSMNLGRVEPDHPMYPAWEEFNRRLPLMFGGVQVLWDFKQTARACGKFLSWTAELIAQDPDDNYARTFAEKLPVVEIGNGDYISLDLATGEVVYLSHDDADERLHGRVIASNFTDFITRWSWTCLVWPDFMPEEPFYSQATGKLAEPSPELSLWHDWLRGAPLPPE